MMEGTVWIKADSFGFFFVRVIVQFNNVFIYFLFFFRTFCLFLGKLEYILLLLVH